MEIEFDGRQHEVGRLIKQIHCKLQAEADAEMKRHDLTFSQAQILNYLERHDGQATQKELENFLRISHPSVVGLVQRLEAKGFVETSVAEDDRRLKIIRVTDRAIAVRTEIQDDFLQNQSPILKGFSDAEIEDLVRMLHLVQTNIDNSLSQRRRHNTLSK